MAHNSVIDDQHRRAGSMLEGERRTLTMVSNADLLPNPRRRPTMEQGHRRKMMAHTFRPGF
eukprot:COSAG01_NODE_8306_length_2837_cov_2.009861_2_plen_61_part_00